MHCQSRWPISNWHKKLAKLLLVPWKAVNINPKGALPLTIHRVQGCWRTALTLNEWSALWRRVMLSSVLKGCELHCIQCVYLLFLKARQLQKLCNWQWFFSKRPFPMFFSWTAKIKLFACIVQQPTYCGLHNHQYTTFCYEYSPIFMPLYNYDV